MAITLQEIIDRAEQEAIGIGGPDDLSALIDSEMTAETIYPHAVRYVIKRQAAAGGDLHDLEVQRNLVVATGQAALPEEVLKSTWHSWTFPGYQYTSYRSQPDYERILYNAVGQINYWTLKGKDVIRFTPAGSAIDTFNGTIKLIAPSVPAAPASASDPIALADKTAQDVIMTIACVMTGQLPLKTVLEASIG